MVVEIIWPYTIMGYDHDGRMCNAIYLVIFLLLSVDLLIWTGRVGVGSWPWSHGSGIYNYLWNQCLSPLMLWVRISIRTRSRTLCDKVCQWLAAGRWFSPGPPVSPWYKQSGISVRGIHFTSFYEFSLGLWSCSYSVSVCGFFAHFCACYASGFFLFE
jgi:hypothetical protein